MNRPRRLDPADRHAPPRGKASRLAALRAGLRRRAETVLLYGAVGLGSMLGGVSRALVSMAGIGLFGAGFPWGTLAANVAGSYAIGFYAAFTGPDGRLFAGSRQRQFVMAGFCGGFTTFSMFSLEAFNLARSGRIAQAGLYVGASAVLWLAAAWLGHISASRLNRLKGA